MYRFDLCANLSLRKKNDFVWKMYLNPIQAVTRAPFSHPRLNDTPRTCVHILNHIRDEYYVTQLIIIN